MSDQHSRVEPIPEDLKNLAKAAESYAIVLAQADRDHRPVSEQTIRDLSESFELASAEQFGCHHQIRDCSPMVIIQLVERIAQAEQRAAQLEAALSGVCRLFEEPSPFYIKKLGDPIANADQDVIDKAFIAAREALRRGEKLSPKV